MNKFFLYFVFSLLVSCSSLKNVLEAPKVKLQDVKISELSGLFADLKVVLEVQNPNKIDFDVKNLRYALDINSKHITSGTMKEKVIVKAKDKTTVTLPIRVEYKDILSSALMILKKETLPYKINGSAEIGPFTIPFNDTGDVDSHDVGILLAFRPWKYSSLDVIKKKS